MGGVWGDAFGEAGYGSHRTLCWKEDYFEACFFLVFYYFASCLLTDVAL